MYYPQDIFQLDLILFGLSKLQIFRDDIRIVCMLAFVLYAQLQGMHSQIPVNAATNDCNYLPKRETLSHTHIHTHTQAHTYYTHTHKLTHT